MSGSLALLASYTSNGDDETAAHLPDGVVADDVNLDADDRAAVMSALVDLGHRQNRRLQQLGIYRVDGGETDH